MNKSRLCLVFLAFWLNVSTALAHGRSEQMTRELNAKVPEWLSIGVPIKAEPATSFPSDQIVFRSRSGGATNSRNRVQIPSRGIQIELDYEIDWTGNNEAGTGVSLSPDGKRLVVNAGPTSHLYEIEANGTYREIPLQLPHVTYDAGIKGYLRGWSWADDQTLVARAEITDEAGHEIIESRIYVFHMKEGALSRLDLSALKLTQTDGIEVIGIGSDLSRLKLSVGNAFVIAKADLKSPPKIEKKEADAPTTIDPLVPPKQRALKVPDPNPALTPSEESTSSTLWSIIVVLIVTAIGLLWLLFKRRS